MVIGWKDKVFDWIIIVFLAFVGIVTILPILVVISISLTTYSEIVRNGGFILFPSKLTLAAYNEILFKSNIKDAFEVTGFVAVVGTIANLVLTVFLAYPLSRKDLPGRGGFLLFIIFTMLFSGGMIPTYLVVKNLGLLDTVWALIIPSAISAFNVLVMKSFFEGLPPELFESAQIDGASELRILLTIVMPLSVPVMLTVGLFYLVANWNVFMAAVLYVSDPQLQPLQVVVKNIITMAGNSLNNVDQTVPPETIKMASVILASLPVIVVYPFIQKYFTKGMLLGAVKG